MDAIGNTPYAQHAKETRSPPLTVVCATRPTSCTSAQRQHGALPVTYMRIVRCS